MIVGELLALFGCILLIRRLCFVPQRRTLPSQVGTSPTVSIIVPARNEELTLPRLLASLQKLDYPDYEVIVVDDCSTDRTAAVALAAEVQLIRGEPRPAGWNGKQWACAQGAARARGEWLLFTDADTWHEPSSLGRVIDFVHEQRLAVASTLPFHDGESWWERLLGPFHLMLVAVTAPFAEPQPQRKFAIGQYLLFSRTAYQTLGGHAAVRGCLVEDLTLVRRAMECGLAYGLYTGPRLFGVKMYASLGDFVRGWRRNFRAGFDESPWTAPLEVTAMIAALTGGFHAWETWPAAVIALTTITLMMLRQSLLGRFSFWGPILFPFSIAMFCWITVLAVFDRILRRPQHWKGREFHLVGGGS